LNSCAGGLSPPPKAGRGQEWIGTDLCG